ncbi:CoA-binding protein [Desulforhopalus sp. IMCC35007]|uniref:CoA-binding protein n=1 Tax=Desulforhopalus sp. IMCC35007 TaxID=2569543 RepID=UPI0010ADC298|nr:CoA-binding protein [Desulforhopalus sp. IMCC35007]TKB12080.1 CoA-binding protein [Desulforhopalus sp. IMCC35007]
MQSLYSLEENTLLTRLLTESTSIAIVGLSPKEQRPSNMVGRYLLENGYTVYPVNPGQREIFGLVCYSDLTELKKPVDIVDIFRKSTDVLEVVQQALRMPRLPRAIWMQQGIVNHDAAALAKEHGITVVMDRCIKVDHQNLVKM